MVHALQGDLSRPLFYSRTALSSSSPQHSCPSRSTRTFPYLPTLRGPTMTKDTSVTMPQLMYESSPFLRLILIFRNPVERYYSAFYYYR
jgi:hypothetical protein